MLRFLADENFANEIIRGLRRRLPDIDIVRVQDVGLRTVDDPVILDWAAREGRLLLTHDVKTITRFAYERVRMGKPMPGVIEVNTQVGVGKVIEDMLLIIGASLSDSEWENQVFYIPM